MCRTLWSALFKVRLRETICAETHPSAMAHLWREINDAGRSVG